MSRLAIVTLATLAVVTTAKFQMPTLVRVPEKNIMPLDEEVEQDFVGGCAGRLGCGDDAPHMKWYKYKQELDRIAAQEGLSLSEEFEQAELLMDGQLGVAEAIELDDSALQTVVAEFDEEEQIYHGNVQTLDILKQLKGLVNQQLEEFKGIEKLLLEEAEADQKDFKQKLKGKIF